jgi:molecular chaperone GrpE
MSEPWQGPKKVKVTVIDDKVPPASLDLREEVRKGVTPAEEQRSATERSSATTEPDWRERYLRLAADLDNTKKRLAQSYARQAEQEKEQLLTDFLEVADNLERALAHANDPNAGSLMEGMQAIQRQFQQTLVKHGVRSFAAKGQPFDPERHEAISVTHQPGLPPETVVDVAQPGYTIDDKVLRPARVVVSGGR